MPINNDIFGVYKSIRVSGEQLVAKSVNRNRKMSTKVTNYLQATPKSRILDIAGTSDDITIEAPILIGGGSTVDGRNFVNQKVKEILRIDGNVPTLPVLSSAKYTIGESGASVTLSLKSDGDPRISSGFAITTDVIAELDPLGAGGPSREAVFYDFRAQLGSRKYYIMSADITLDAGTEEAYFLNPGNWDGTEANSYFNVGGVGFTAGKQFPFLGVSSITLSGGGKAAVMLTPAGEAAGLGLTSVDVTYQKAGETIYSGKVTNDTFILEIATPGVGTGWTSLFQNLDLSRAVIDTANFRVDTGIMTMDFNFKCWVSGI